MNCCDNISAVIANCPNNTLCDCYCGLGTFTSEPTSSVFILLGAIIIVVFFISLFVKEREEKQYIEKKEEKT